MNSWCLDKHSGPALAVTRKLTQHRLPMVRMRFFSVAQARVLGPSGNGPDSVQ